MNESPTAVTLELLQIEDEDNPCNRPDSSYMLHILRFHV